MPSPSPVDLFVSRIERLGIPYFVTGAVASIIYGEPRLPCQKKVPLAVANSHCAGIGGEVRHGEKLDNAAVNRSLDSLPHFPWCHNPCNPCNPCQKKRMFFHNILYKISYPFPIFSLFRRLEIDLVALKA